MSVLVTGGAGYGGSQAVVAPCGGAHRKKKRMMDELGNLQRFAGGRVRR
jgi:UDP-glucose 4-epimerase